MKVGDMILCRKPAPWGKKTLFGIVIEYQAEGICSDTDWALVLWEDDTMTWEDVECSLEDGTFEVISESR